jgi:hypothetical protein
MTELTLIANAVLTLGLGGIGLLLRHFMSKVDAIEKSLGDYLTDEDARTIIEDKLQSVKVSAEALKDSVGEIRVKLDRILEILINERSQIRQS